MDRLNLRVRRYVKSIALPDHWANHSDLFRTVVRVGRNPSVRRLLRMDPRFRRDDASFPDRGSPVNYPSPRYPIFSSKPSNSSKEWNFTFNSPLPELAASMLTG